MKKIVAILMAMLMVMSVTVVFASGAADKDTQPKVPVIIGFKDKPSQADKDMIRGHGGDIKYSYTIIDAIAAKLPDQVIDKIKKNPRVKYVEKDTEVHTLGQTLPWGVDRIDADLAWATSKGTGIKVAIIDTGIDRDHPDLQANIAGGINYVVGSPFDGKSDDNWDDDNGHGTHCAGIVAAIDNAIGVIGVAPEASLYAVKVLRSSGSGWLSDVIAGIEWTIDPNGDGDTSDRMDVDSMSFGGGDSQAMHDACDKAYAAGIVLIAAAGNSGDGDSTTDEYSYPAAYDSVIAVGATNIGDEAPYWSNSGPHLELAAPGVDINSTWNDGGYNTISGTSMACPHVSGTAALVIASDPSLSNVDVRLRLQETAEDLGDTGFDKQYGYGLVDAENATQPSDAAPVVDIVNPADGSTVSGTEIIIEASASDDIGINKVEYCIDSGAYEAMTYNSSTGYWEATWNSTSVADGSHTITAKATDTIEQTSTDSITVSVDNVDDPPTVEITSPVDGATVSGTITIEASAGDDRGVSKVDFYINDTLLATDDTEPYNASWDTTTVADGAYNITAIATDTAGQTASDTNGVTVDNTPPAQVTGLNVTTVSSSQLDLAWDANSETDLDHYNVYRSTTSGDPYDLVASPATNSYSDTGLAASTTYYYTVSAVDIAGNEGIASEEANGTTCEAVNNDVHVSAIDMWYDTAGPNYFIYTKVTIVDSKEDPVAEATVYLEMTLPDDSKASGSGTTNGDGTVTFKRRSRQTGTYTSTVTNVEKIDWTYDPDANVETSETLTVP